MTERSGMSRRQALTAGGMAAVAPLLTATRQATKQSASLQQSGWRWCHKCQGLWYGSAGSACPATGAHESTGSGNYILTYGSGSGQPGWRWCHKCQGLWYGSNSTGGACPATGAHESGGSVNYILNYL